MTPPLDNPRKLRDKKFNQQIIDELDELGILDAVSDLIFNNPNASIPEIQSEIANKFNYTDVGAGEIEFLRNGFTRPQAYGHKAPSFKRNNKTIKEQLENDFNIVDEKEDE